LKNDDHATLSQDTPLRLGGSTQAAEVILHYQASSWAPFTSLMKF
jgi:hypothetical protein